MMRRIADAVPGAVVELLRSAPLSRGKAAFAWRMSVGPALLRATSVDLQGRMLVVTVATRQWAQEVHRSSPIILRRLERYLGVGALTGLDVHFGTPNQEPRTPNPSPDTGK